jgi:hypothetical protein
MLRRKGPSAPRPPSPQGGRIKTAALASASHMALRGRFHCEKSVNAATAILTCIYDYFMTK